MDCAICFEELKTAKTIMACGHAFHFRCTVSWFESQSENSLPENCPCCRHEAEEMDCLPITPISESNPLEPMESQESMAEVLTMDVSAAQELQLSYLQGVSRSQLDRFLISFFGESQESQESQEPMAEVLTMDVSAAQELQLSRPQMHRLLISFGGVGLTDLFWNVCSTGNQHALLYKTLLRDFIVCNGGRIMTDEEWATIYQTFSQPFPIQPINITWVRTGEGRWERTVIMNPEEDIWDAMATSNNPPDSLTELVEGAIKKIQAVWRGSKQRSLYSAARCLQRIQNA